MSLSIAALLIAAPHAALATPGDLDPTFSRDGIKRLDDRGRAASEAIALGPASRIVVGLTERSRGRSSATVTRMQSRGDLDRRFAGDGFAEIHADLGQSGGVRALAILPDGRIVVGMRGESAFVVARLLPNGRPDPSFAGDGVADVPLGRAADVADVIVAPDGTTTVAGSFTGVDDKREIVVVRLTPSGELDAAYSGDGVATADFPFRTPSSVGGAVMQPDGRLVVAGTAGVGREAIPAVARLGLDGAIDPTFVDTALPSLFPLGGSGNDVAIDSAGRLLVGACCEHGAVRLLPEGALDDSFALGERDIAEAIATDPGGRIVMLTEVGGCAGRSCSDIDYRLERRAPDGSPDRTFAKDATFYQDFAKHNDVPSGFAVQQDDRIIVVGESGHRAFIARHESAPGPPDADGDGRVNKRDRCAGRYGRERDGCPSFSRSLSMRNRRQADLFTGRLRSPDDRCVNRRKVEVRRRVRGFDKILSEVSTDPRGHWKSDGVLTPGVYYALVEEDFNPQIGHCVEARSNAITIR